jgi:hypothetical protein
LLTTVTMISVLAGKLAGIVQLNGVANDKELFCATTAAAALPVTAVQLVPEPRYCHKVGLAAPLPTRM